MTAAPATGEAGGRVFGRQTGRPVLLLSLGRGTGVRAPRPGGSEPLRSAFAGYQAGTEQWAGQAGKPDGSLAHGTKQAS